MGRSSRSKRKAPIPQEQLPFGIYRPLSIASCEPLLTAVEESVELSNAYLLDTRRSAAPAIVAASEFAITFVEKRDVTADMQQGRMVPYIGRKAVEAWQQDPVLRTQNPQEISLDTFTLFGGGAMVYFIDEESQQVFKEESAAVETWLRSRRLTESSLLGTHARTPNHMTLARQQMDDEIEPITPDEETDIGRIFDEQLSLAGVQSVMLDPLMIGRNYVSPLPIFEQVMTDTL